MLLKADLSRILQKMARPDNRDVPFVHSDTYA